MKSFGFDASAVHRTVLGVGFIGASILMVWMIERSSNDEARVSLQPVANGQAKQPWPVTIESTFPVATWSVRVLGVEQAAIRHDAYSWTGTLSAQIGDELLVQAQAIEADAAPNHGLRLLIGSAPERLVWGGGDVTATVEFTK